MMLADHLGKIRSEYNPLTDSIEIEFGEGLKRTSTLAYEDVVHVHLGTKEGSPGLQVQGMTMNGVRYIREKLHGLLAGRPEEKAVEAKELIENLEVEAVRDMLVLKDNRFWSKTDPRIVKRFGEHVSIVTDVLGLPVGAVFENLVGLDAAGVTEFFNLIFSGIIPSEEELHDPTKAILSRELAARWVAPLVGAGA